MSHKSEIAKGAYLHVKQFWWFVDLIFTVQVTT